MDHRDPPRIFSGDEPPDDRPTSPSGPGRRSGRLEASARSGARKPSPTRLGLALGLGLALVGLLAVGAPRAIRWVVARLHARPEHQIAFAEIELVPPPPAWIKGGAVGLLEEARRGANMPERFGALDIDKARIRNALALHSPWVRAVDRVELSYPNRIAVAIRYREPVAFTYWKAGDPTFDLDAEGVILPRFDAEGRRAAGMVPIAAEDRRPIDARPGRYWSSIGPGGEVREPDPPIRDATALARFLRSGPIAEAEDDLPPGWAIGKIYLPRGPDPSLFVVTRAEPGRPEDPNPLGARPRPGRGRPADRPREVGDAPRPGPGPSRAGRLAGVPRLQRPGRGPIVRGCRPLTRRGEGRIRTEPGKSGRSGVPLGLGPGARRPDTPRTIAK